ncbi:MAG TPA: polysaccharide deacetylase family protein [Firmicutes bacterium]|nr:polysaccharide deacetylase family protein [Bacillota bacterium]
MRRFNTLTHSLAVLSFLLLLLCAGFSSDIHARRLSDEPVTASPGMSDVFPPRYHDRVIVLMYHQIGFQHQRRGVIPPELFDAHMLYLKQMGFKPISRSLFENFLDRRAKVPHNAILITFDDGYESFYKYAYPILKKYRFPAINFVIVGYTPDSGLALARKVGVPHLSWGEMEEMERSGLVSIESHTFDSHYYVPVDKLGRKRPVLISRVYDPKIGRQESEDEYERRVWCDLWLAKSLLEEHLHKQITSLCFPYGAYNSTVIKLARDVGYRYFYTVRSGVNRPGRGIALIKRISAGDSYITIPELNRRIIQVLSPAPPLLNITARIKAVSARMNLTRAARRVNAAESKNHRP